jgi:hypothetical protein
MDTRKLLENCIDERFEDGVLRVDRRAYTNPDLLEWEFEHIFEGNWVYLCHESQVSQPKDFLTLTVGRQPVLVTRNKKVSYEPSSTLVRIGVHWFRVRARAAAAPSPACSMAGPTIWMAA